MAKKTLIGDLSEATRQDLDAARLWFHRLIGAGRTANQAAGEVESKFGHALVHANQAATDYVFGTTYTRKKAPVQKAASPRLSGEGFSSFEVPTTAPTDAAPTIDPAHNPDQARYIQTVLKNAGYYHGAIDGIWGPQSIAANDAYNAAGQQPASVAAPVVPDVAAGAGGVSGGGAATPSATSPAPSTPTPSGPLTPADRAELLQVFPDKGWMLDDPQLGPMLMDFHLGKIDAAGLQSRITTSDWFKIHGTVQTVNQLKDEAARYGLSFSEATLTDFASQIATGQKQPGEFRQQLEQQASSAYGVQVADAIKRGVDPKTYMDPYVQRAAQLLELNPRDINWTDPKWLRAIQNVDAKTGTKSVMTFSDWDTLLKTDPTYGYDRTQGARDQASQFAQQIAVKFGKVSA